MLGKLLGIASIGEALSSLHLARRVIADLAVVAMLAIIGAILAAALVIAVLFECHQLLMRHGLDADMAAVVIGLLGIVTLGILGAIILHKLRQIKSMPFPSSGGIGGLIGGPLQSLARGFYQGITEKKRPF